jgi:subtilisin family serine protease
MTHRAPSLRRSPAALLSLALLVVAAWPVAPTAAAAAPEAPPIEEQLIVRYGDDVSARGRQVLRERHGLTRLAATPSGRFELVAAPGRSLREARRDLRAEPAVEAVAQNGRREFADDITEEPRFGDLWGLHNGGQVVRDTSSTAGVDIDGPQALRILRGRASTVVAVIDDGIDFRHPDLSARAWVNPGESGAKAANGVDDDGNGYIDDVHGWDFCDDDASVHDADSDRHGTHVAGTIGASLDGQGILGVAPGISLMALKAFEGGTACPFGDFPIIEALEYAASMRVRIINASWGGTSDNPALATAIAESGALLVAAAGNQGWDMDAGIDPRFYPAAYPLANIISVGAIDQAGRRANFSNGGPVSVDIAAPGVNILSTLPPRDTCPSPCYGWSNGTSMAAPHVAGVAALVGSRESLLLQSPTKLKQRILDRGRSLTGGREWLRTGRLVNAQRAVDAAGPVVQAPDRFAVKTGSTIGSTAPLTVIWPAATDKLHAVAGYRLDKRRGTAAARVADGTTATQARTSVRLGAGYRFALSATDTLGNRSATVTSPVITTSQHSEASSLVRYSRGWGRRSNAAALGGATMTTTRAGATTVIGFTGRALALVATRGPGRGAVRVYVDGVLKTTIDLERATTVHRTVVYSTWWTAPATHEIRLVTVDAGRVDVDGWVVVR